MKVLTNLDLTKNQILNAVLQNLASAPDNPREGQYYYNSTDKILYVYNGTAWVSSGVKVEASEINGHIKIGGEEVTVYSLPLASASTVGGVKIGAGLSISAEGTLSATGGGTADAVDWANVIDKPTALSQFTNDENFIDNTVNNLANYYLKTETYTQTEINNLIGQIATLSVEKVDALPEGEAIKTNVIYLVAKTNSDTNDVYTEYMRINDTWEILGDTSVDLSNYLTQTGDTSNTTVAFASAETRVLPNTGESLAIIIGKIIKYLADLKTVAFTGDYADLTNKPNSIKYYDLTVSGATATYTAEGTVLNVSIMDATTHESVIADVTVSADNVVTVTCAEIPATALTARITYVGA